METKNYDFILPFFLGDDELRPKFMRPNLSDGYVYATNSHIAIKVHAENLINNYSSDPKFPNMEKIFTLDKNDVNMSIINVDDLMLVLSKLKWMRQPNNEDCSHCDGDGVIECPQCKKEHTCDKCNGVGHFNKGIIEMSLLINNDLDAVIKIGSLHFKPDFIHVLAICAKVLGMDIIRFYDKQDGLTAGIFIMADAEILIMPKIYDDHYHKVYSI